MRQSKRTGCLHLDHAREWLADIDTHHTRGKR
jgi:hypothetical protein